MFRITSPKLTAALVAIAAAVPAAAAAQPLDNGPGSKATHTSYVVLPSAPSASSESGFQWGDAGIGAAAALGLMGVGTVALSGTRRRSHRLPA